MKSAVLISCFNWYANRLRPIRTMLNVRYEVTVIMANYNHIRKKRYRTQEKDCIYVDVPEYKKNISIKRLYSHIYFAKEVSKQLEIIKPNLIYALIPPNYVADVCANYVKKTGAKCYFDIIDLWPESLPIGNRKTPEWHRTYCKRKGRYFSFYYCNVCAGH